MYVCVPFGGINNIRIFFIDLSLELPGYRAAYRYMGRGRMNGLEITSIEHHFYFKSRIENREFRTLLNLRYLSQLIFFNNSSVT